MSRIERQINLNLQLMSNMGKKKNLEIFILNAFEPSDSGHNFGSLFSYRYGLDGFGDFATEKRFPASGGSSPTRIVRYYYWDKYILKEIANNSYPASAVQLKNSPYWVNHIRHHSSCGACNKIEIGNYNNGHSYWKEFRILHYLNSITTETRHQFATAVSEEDLNPDGYDSRFNVEAL